eukprot:349660-Chlamydomonas_euryale.AAC.6
MRVSARGARRRHFQAPNVSVERSRRASVHVCRAAELATPPQLQHTGFTGVGSLVCLRNPFPAHWVMFRFLPLPNFPFVRTETGDGANHSHLP